MKSIVNKEILDTMIKNPSNWKGIFYYNRKDPRLMVPKPYTTMGWTLNYASIYSYLFFIAVVSIAVAFKFFI